jgi:membrane protease YdiL (CAAX protease family)
MSTTATSTTSSTTASPSTTAGQRSTGGDATPVRQYTVRGVLGVWAAAALPMGALSWGFAPWLASQLSGPGALVRALLTALTIGLVWQFVLVLVLVRREQGTLRWRVVQDALWLHAPRNPRTGRRGGRLWWILLPLTLAFAAREALPKPPVPAARDLALFLESETGQDLLAGNWTLFALMAVMGLFNTVLGEELLFRGWLLPRMQSLLGGRGWLLNGALFAAYHLHVPWAMPRALLHTVLTAGPTQRYRSAWIGIAVHSSETVVITALVLALTLR